MSFLTGISDFGLSVLDKAPAIITALNPNSTTAAVKTTATNPANSTGTGAMPAWVKPVAIGAGVLFAVVLIWKLLSGRSKK